MAKMGRPKKTITQSQLDSLCGLQCTQEEMAYFFDCTIDTIANRIKEWTKDYENGPLTFSEYFSLKRQAGRISLRRSQFRMAEHNPAMAIFLGKNLLGQRDKFEFEGSHDVDLKITFDYGNKPDYGSEVEPDVPSE